ncbi:MAG TPA: HD domain-containing phosphohydrolase [Geobacteraceae bacterium]|nr:HD domain-containing phosphohydrolase [Geobacteraceae bacterium]
MRVYEELALIYALTRRLGTEIDLREICRMIIEEAENILNPANTVLLLADEEKGVLRTVFASGSHMAEALAFTHPLESGILGQICTNRRSVIVSDMEREVQPIPLPFPAKRLLAVPLVANDTAIGVIFALDKLDGSDFDSRESKLLSAISSVAALAIKNAQLYSNIKNLFDGFINASVTAVEARDPTTSGHSTRVALLTVELAKRVDASDLPVFRNMSFSSEQLLEIRYAGLLHDFGKIGVSESVLVKETKLSRDHMERIMDRFSYIRERKTREALEKKLEILLNEGKDAYLEAIGAIDAELVLAAARLDEDMELLRVANDPRVLRTELPELARLKEIAELFYSDLHGENRPYLTPFEFKNLNVLKGSLNDAERREIESHVTHSYNFLNRIPWTKNLSRIADVVYAHHEKLDGSGYPRRLAADDIPLQAKMMTVADIYDALTASDRPYKKAVSVEKALFILEMEAKEGKLEPHLVQIFRDAQVYRVAEELSGRR